MSAAVVMIYNLFEEALSVDLVFKLLLSAPLRALYL